MRWIVLTCLLASPGWAADCPAAPDHGVAFAKLVESIRAAPDQNAARRISNDMWALWADAPDEPAQEMLDAGMTKRAAYDFLGAINDFDRLIAYCPSYAEGYNQRAFVNFLRQDFQSALADLDRAIDLSPSHIAALSGRALTLIGLGREEAAQADLEIAVGLNPWLPERGLLKKPVGDDL